MDVFISSLVAREKHFQTLSENEILHKCAVVNLPVDSVYSRWQELNCWRWFRQGGAVFVLFQLSEEHPSPTVAAGITRGDRGTTGWWWVVVVGVSLQSTHTQTWSSWMDALDPSIRWEPASLEDQTHLNAATKTSLAFLCFILLLDGLITAEFHSDSAALGLFP